MNIRLLLILGSFILQWSCQIEPKVKIDLSELKQIPETDSLAANTNKIGVAAMLSPKEALPAYEEIINYLATKMHREIDMLFTKDYTTMNTLVKKKKVLAAFVCSGPYVKGHDEWGMELLVAPSLHGETHYYSYIIVNKNCEIKSLTDLKNKKFAFTDPESNTGKLVPTYEISLLGKRPEKFFAEIIYTGSHDKSIEAVANNLVDGAAVDHLIWEYINHKDSSITSKTKIIKRIGPFASPPFVTHPDCEPEMKSEIKNILLHMHQDAEGKKILDKLQIDKFVTIQDSCYQSVRKMQEWLLKE